MSREFSTALLGKVVGHICLNVGWNNIQQSSLSILVDILQRYLIELGKCTHAFTNGAGRTESNTEDVFLAFSDFGITESDLLDYLLNVDSLAFPSKLPRFPVEHPAQLCFPKIDDPQRPEWIPSYLPATRPESELSSAVAAANSAPTNGQPAPSVPAIEDEAPEQQQNAQLGPAASQVDNGTKRPDDGSVKTNSSKKLKVLAEEGTPMREVILIQMTPSGFLSAIRDGRLPDACHPSKLLLDPRNSEHENSSDDEPNPDPLKEAQGTTVGNAKATGKKRKRGGKTAAEAKADKFFDEKIVSNNTINSSNNNNNNNKISNNNSSNNNKDGDNVNSTGSLITSIKLDKQAATVKEKKTKERDKLKIKEKLKVAKLSKVKKDAKDKAALLLKTKKGKKRKNPGGGRQPKPTKVARLSSPSKGEAGHRRLPIITTKLPQPVPDSTKFANSGNGEADAGHKKNTGSDARVGNDIYSDNDSQTSVKLKGDNDRVPTPQAPPLPVKLKVTKAERLKKKERLFKKKKGRRELKIKSPPEIKEPVKNPPAKEVTPTKKDGNVELLRSIDDAISTVIAEGRRNVNERSPADERGRKKLVVKDVFLSDSEPELRRDPSPHSDDDIEVIDHPKTPDLSPADMIDNLFAPTEVPKDIGEDYRDFGSPERRSSKKKVSPLEEFVRQMPLRLGSEQAGGAEDSNSRLLTPSVTITPVPLTPLNAAAPPAATLAPPTTTLTVKTLAERKGLPPLEIDPDKKKRKEKRKDKKEKKIGGRKKEVPKLTLKLLSSAASLSEPLFEPTPLVAAPAIVPPKKPGPAPTAKNSTAPKGKGKNSLLRKMVTEVESDSETPLPIVEKVKSPPTKQKTPKVKEPKEPKEPKPPKEQPPKKELKSQQQPQQQHRSPKKEKQTPPKLTSPLPPVLPEITITPIPAPSSSKKDKKKDKPAKEGKKKKVAAAVEAVIEPVVEKVKVKIKEEKPPKLSKAALKEEPKEERMTRGKKEKEQEKEKEHTPTKKETKKEAKANKEKDKPVNQEAQVEVVTVGTILDADGNKIWICPACAKPDDGSPMIGCDQCDDWYHWECVGISVPPSDEEEWFCGRCTKLRSKPTKKQRKS